LRSSYSFEPILIADLRLKYLDLHEHIERSSLATLKRYRSATNHLANFAGKTPAHDIQAEEFLRHLRVSPNGHQHTAKRSLRDKGIQFILETCRSMYKFAARKRHLPPYGEKPFDEVRISKSKILDRQPVVRGAFCSPSNGWSNGRLGARVSFSRLVNTSRVS
jgi:hypothetical protein